MPVKSLNHNSRRRQIFSEKFFGFLLFAGVRFFLFFACIVMVVTYVLKTSSVSTMGYDVASLRRENAILEREKISILNEISVKRSLSSVEPRLREAGFVEPTRTVYLSNREENLARR